jgi:hypothetical protein
MTAEQQKFESTYHYKVVRPLGKVYQIPQKEYIVTSALLNWEDDGKTTIFAIKALDYTVENKQWITIKIAADEFEKCISDFEVVKDGYEDYVKPKILDEVLFSWEREENGHWLTRFSSFVIPENHGYNKIPVGDVTRSVFAGKDEYLFIYKSVFDIDKPSNYLITIPNFEYKEEVENYVREFREDVLANKVAYGINKRLLK